VSLEGAIRTLAGSANGSAIPRSLAIVCHKQSNASTGRPDHPKRTKLAPIDPYSKEWRRQWIARRRREENEVVTPLDLNDPKVDVVNRSLNPGRKQRRGDECHCGRSENDSLPTTHGY